MSVRNEQGIVASRSRKERSVRIAVGILGVVLLGVGLRKLWGLPDRISTIKWALAPVVIHDALVAPMVCLVGWALSQLLPGWTRPALLTGTVVTASLVLVSLSVVGDEGATHSNPSLDPRNYGAGLLIALIVVWGIVGLSLLVSARSARRGG